MTGHIPLSCELRVLAFVPCLGRCGSSIPRAGYASFQLLEAGGPPGKFKLSRPNRAAAQA